MRKSSLYIAAGTKASKAFTLLEVLVSIAILAIALLGFYQGQASVTRLAVRSEAMSQALYLAEQKMTELELQLRNKTFVSLPEEEKGDFKDEHFKEFKWKRELEKVDLGCFIPKELISGGGDSEQGQNAQASAAQGLFAMIDKVFENAVRKIRVTVEWTEGNKPRSVTLAQLYVRYKDLPSF